jgi:hypothetical protein
VIFDENDEPIMDFDLMQNIINIIAKEGANV